MNTILKENAVTKHRQAGFTLVEMMVGVIVGLIATVVMFQVFAVSEGQKRTTTGAGDAQQSGLVSLFQMERDIRMAGFGLNFPTLLGCQTNGFNQVAGAAFSVPLAPVTITNGAGGAPDSITVIYGNSDLLTAAERLRNPMVAAADVIDVNNRYGFNLGDVVVVGEPGKICSMAQVSSLPGSSNIGHAAGSYLDSANQPTNTKYNGAITGFPGYGAWVRANNTGGRILNLGNSPTFITYAVQNNTLVGIDATAPGLPPQVIADGIVQLQAQYGFDGNNDGKLTAPTNVATLNPAGGDQWADAVPAGMTADNWKSVVAVRLAIVARSVTPERGDTAGNCSVTTVGPRWFARDPVTAYNIDVSATAPGTTWKCYRYRVFEVTIPIRNVAWFPSET
jgi:type IV pilus assembly protein PilW